MNSRFSFFRVEYLFYNKIYFGTYYLKMINFVFIDMVISHSENQYKILFSYI